VSARIFPDSAVEYEPLLHRLTLDERAQYDRIADLWSELFEFEAAEQRRPRTQRHRYAHFYWHSSGSFAIAMAYTLPDVIAAIEKDSPRPLRVLSLFNPSEAQERKVRDARPPASNCRN
jgi:hypothetical protein